MENQTDSSGISGWVWGVAAAFIIPAILALAYFMDVV
jgi:hypothetical protein